MGKENKEGRVIVLDVDGTLTDGAITYSSSGEELKSFHAQDGFILKQLSDLGYRIIVLTGRDSEAVSRRMKELGINEVFQGAGSDKLSFYLKLIENEQIDEKYICYIGDDIPDWPIMRRVGMPACPADACEEVKEVSRYISSKNGGKGAVRDILEHYLKENGQWAEVIKGFS